MNDCLECMYRGILVHVTGLESGHVCQEEIGLVEQTVPYWTRGRNDIQCLVNHSYQFDKCRFVAVQGDCVPHD